jgi:hypothetical protein
LTRDEVPRQVLEDWFDYQDEETFDGYILYRGDYYHTDQFMCGGVPGWPYSYGDSYFSGILLRVSSDGEQYQVAGYSVTG